MQNHDFDEIIDRRHTNSYKWDTPQDDDILPMWVADMDFRTAPCIIEALRKRVDLGIFGYTKVPQTYYDAIVGWFSRRHGWTIDPGHIIYTTGVVPALSAIIKALTRPGDKVIVQTPAYNCFFSSIRNNGCILSANELIRHSSGSYSIDFDDLRRRAADPDTKLMILCNPHNPTGVVWTRDELTEIGEICFSNGVTVISDEIHCELTLPGNTYTPFASISDEFASRCVVCNSPSKAFNIAGLQIANILAADPQMRGKIDRAINDNEVCDVNPFGVDALIAAYNEGEPWLNDLRSYIRENYLTASRRLAEELPLFTFSPLMATYLMWIDIAPTGLDSDQVCDLLLKEGKVMLSPGSIYGKGGENFVRLNIACPRSRLIEGLDRIVNVLKPLVKENL